MTTEPLRIGLPQQLRGYLFLDLEASGVHARSYPIEAGWCGVDLVAEAFLIRPHNNWGEDDWSLASERIHGIPRQLTISQGIDVVEAATRLNWLCRGREIVSDNPEFDQGWLSELFYAAGVQQDFSLQDANQLSALASLLSGLDVGMAQVIEERVKGAFPHPHRAAPDARRAAAIFLALAVPDAVEAIIAVA